MVFLWLSPSLEDHRPGTRPGASGATAGEWAGKAASLWPVVVTPGGHGPSGVCQWPFSIIGKEEEKDRFRSSV